MRGVQLKFNSRSLRGKKGEVKIKPGFLCHMMVKMVEMMMMMMMMVVKMT